MSRPAENSLKKLSDFFISLEKIDDQPNPELMSQLSRHKGRA